MLQIPDFGSRFWGYQICNQETDGYAELGKMYHTKPGIYMLAVPKWNAKIPSGSTKVFRSDTDMGVFIPRVFQTDEPEDKN